MIATFELSTLMISRWWTEVDEAMMCRSDPEISVVRAPVRRVTTSRFSQVVVAISIEKMPKTGNNVRTDMKTGKKRAEATLPSFRAPRPCHVMAIEMMERGTPETATGYSN